jgi:nucleotide-binding universal stress UspA family protein
MSANGGRTARLTRWERLAQGASLDTMTILVAYEPNATDRAPIRFAAAAARFAATPLVVASVHAPPRTGADVETGELAPLRTELAQPGDLKDVRTRAVLGSTAAEVTRGLQRIAAEEHADLVVVGASRRGAIGRVTPGATSQRIINGSRCPVVVVPEDYELPSRVSVVGVAYVPTAEGDRALRIGAAIARMAGAVLRVVTVIKPSLGADASAGPAKEAAERRRAKLEAMVAAATTEHDDGIHAEHEIVVDDPSDALLRISPHLDLLVMGSRGYGPMLGVLLGSVSRRVTTSADCPVLVAPRAATPRLWADRTATAALRTTFADAPVACHARDALRDGGVACLVTGRRLNDVREQPVGSFAGVALPTAPVGTFANVRRRRDQGTGSFSGNADHQRQGSFGDTDGDVVARHQGGAVRSRVIARHEARHLLQRIGVGDEDMERALDELDLGYTVLAIRAMDANAPATLDGLEHAA